MSTNEEIIAKIRAGGDRKSLMLELWEQNKGIIYSIAHKYSGLAEFEDLIQEAYIGLDEAVKHYDDTAGAKFSTLLPFWIKQRIRRYITDKNGAVRLPAHIHAKLYRYNTVVRELTSRLNRTPDIAEISAYTGYSKSDIYTVRMCSKALRASSLDKPLNDEDDVTLADILADEKGGCLDIDEEIYREQRAADVWGAVSELPELQERVIKARYLHDLTIAQTGEAEGITEGQVRNCGAKALRELRKSKYQRKLLPYLDDIRGNAMQGTGLMRFNETWTSATEREALRLCSE